MPVLRAGNLAEKSDWLKASSRGIFHVAKGDPADVDLHCHDTDEHEGLKRRGHLHKTTAMVFATIEASRTRQVVDVGSMLRDLTG